MKKIFKLMTIAVFTATMLTACDKKNEPDPSEVEDPTPRITVTLNNFEYTTFNTKVVKILEIDGEQCLCIEGHPQDVSDASQITSETQVCPGFRIVLRGTTAGNYESTTMNGETFYLNGGVRHFEFYKDGALYQSGVFFGDWWGSNATVKLKKIDLDKGTVSLSAEGDMFCSGQALLQGMGYDNAQKGTMKVDINNITFQRQ